MAKLEKKIYVDFDELLHEIENGIKNGSALATLEDSSDFRKGDSKCSVRVFERYSYTGANRVSWNVTWHQYEEGPVFLSAIASGGSSAVCF